MGTDGERMENPVKLPEILRINSRLMDASMGLI